MAKRWAVVLIFLMFVFIPQGFSASRWYAKATIGGGDMSVDDAVLYSYDYISNYYGDSYSYYTGTYGDIFSIKPAAGIEWRGVRDDGTPGIVSFSLEASVGLGFGSEFYTGASIIAVTPGIMGIVSFESRFHLWRFVPYLGVGLSVPMVFFGDGTSYSSYSSYSSSYYSIADKFAWSFNETVLLGLGVAITESIMPVLEVQCSFGMDIDIDIEVRAGCVYKFGK